MSFALDPRLEADSTLIGELPLCSLRLHNNATWPWLILVPRVDGMADMTDLSPSHQAKLMGEIDQTAKALKSFTKSHKLNIASIGNIVRQLHVHVIARQENDSAWPAPVWGQPFKATYEPAEQEKLVAHMRATLDI